MKNIFKKTSRTLIIVSMLCAMLTAGCAKADSNADNNASSNVSSTENTELETYVIPTEVSTDSISSVKLDEPVTIKIPSFDLNSELGITAECTNSNYKYLNVSTLKDIEIDYTITDECIKEIFNITIYDVNGYETIDLNEKIKVSIPYEEGMYVIHSADGVGYDVNAEYIDGKYVFETDKLGSFAMRTESVGRTSSAKTTSFTLEEQTLVDDVTGIQVTGKIPVGAEIKTSMYIIDGSTFYDRWEPPYTVEMDSPEFNNILYYYIEDEYSKKTDNIAKIINEKGWAQQEATAGGNLDISIEFVKDYEVLDFESDLTVTLPFNYRRGLTTGGITDEVTVVQYDYDNKSFATKELVSAEDTPKGMFQFKTKKVGQFYAGGNSEIKSLMHFYGADV